MNKLTDRTVPGVFLGYEPGTKGYRIYDPVKDRLILTRDVIFDESKPWNWEGKDSSSVNVEATEQNTFRVQCLDDTVHDPTIQADGPDAASEDVSEPNGESGSPAASIPSVGVLQTRLHKLQCPVQGHQ